MPRLVLRTGEGQAFDLKLGRNRIGRSEGNDFAVAHPTVSGMHCEIEWANDTIIVRDCGSTNGTFIDGRPIREAALNAGQILQLGDVEFTLDTTEARISIPQIQITKVPRPVMLPDGVMSCAYHLEIPAVYRCTHCQQMMCNECVHQLRRVGGRLQFLCPECSHPCEPIPPFEPDFDLGAHGIART